MRVDVLLTPREVRPELLPERAVVVFDVLRATTTMTAAMAAGVTEIRIFESPEAAAVAKMSGRGSSLLCGERNCLPPPGFDLGNSPAAFRCDLHSGRTLLMATTNGTRAIVAARAAKQLLIGAIVNASAVARLLVKINTDVILLCAGTAGEPAMEDLLGAGAVLDALTRLCRVDIGSDAARIARRLFHASRNDLRSVMTDATGGRNVLAAGLGADIDFASRLDALDIVGRIKDEPLRVILG